MMAAAPPLRSADSRGARLFRGERVAGFLKKSMLACLGADCCKSGTSDLYLTGQDEWLVSSRDTLSGGMFSMHRWK